MKIRLTSLRKLFRTGPTGRRCGIRMRTKSEGGKHLVQARPTQRKALKTRPRWLPILKSERLSVILRLYRWDN